MLARLFLTLILTWSVTSAAYAEPDFSGRLQAADRLAWLTDWYGALPAYADVEKAASHVNPRDAMYAKFGRIRGQMQTLPLSDISEEIAVDLGSPLAKNDARLRLRGLTVKGEIDLEWDVQAAQRDWQEVRQLARELGHRGWENRANGELGIIAFLRGDTGEATALVQQALQTATQSGDVGGQLRYMGTIANGLLLAGYVTQATVFVDRALKFATEHPEAGFPFVVYSTKVLTLLALEKPQEAERFATAAMAEARAGDRRIKEAELLMLLARIADKRGQRDRVIEYLERAVATATPGRVQRLLADAESLLAAAYRSRGDLSQARRHAAAAVSETQAAGSRFSLPSHLSVLAEILAAQGNSSQANRVYQQATDVLEGIMVNVPSREAQARLIGVRSNLYEGHFRLVAQRLGQPENAYDIIERARGRAVADVLRTLPDQRLQTTPAAADQARTISRLQIRLMRARVPAERRDVLEQLWQAERGTAGPGLEERGAGPIPRGNRVAIRTLQQRLNGTEVILEYVLTEPQSFCLVISNHHVKLISLPARAQIDAALDRFNAEIRSPTGISDAAAKALFGMLLQPIPESRSAERLVIVPDGKLHLLPFDALLRANGVPSKIVTTVPSASVFFLIRTKATRSDPARPLLAVGGVPYDRVFAAPQPIAGVTRTGTDGLFDAAYPASLPALPSARAEVQTAARLLGPGSVTLTGDDATESGFRGQNPGTFGVLHFAAHAFADPKFPERAAILLLGDPAVGQDGLLQPREIAQLRLNAGVVVLSACDTAVGPTLGQEGVLNLARAFLLAGARSVIMTLWTVSDATSTALMRRFYENLAEGDDVAEALTRAKTAVVEQFGVGALSTVAAFQIVGVGDYRVARPSAREQAPRTSESSHRARHERS